MKKYKYDVFISFSNKDSRVASRIYSELKRKNINVFYSNITLRKKFGTSWFEEIESALKVSRHMLLICSKASMVSKWVKVISLYTSYKIS